MARGLRKCLGANFSRGGKTTSGGYSVSVAEIHFISENLQIRKICSGTINFMARDAVWPVVMVLITFGWPDRAIPNMPKNGHFRAENFEFPATARRKRPSPN